MTDAGAVRVISGPGLPPLVYWDCDVQHSGVDDGLAFSLRYSGTPVTEPGTYKIQAWGTKYWSGERYAMMRQPRPGG